MHQEQRIMLIPKKGKDSNAGTSESEAFQTLDKVNELDLNPGDTILLKKGSVI